MKNKSLRFKLYTLSLFLMLISIVVGVIGYVSQNKIVKEYSSIIDVNIPNIKSMGLMISRYRLARVYVTELAISGLSPSEAQKIISDYKDAWKGFEVEHQKYLTIEFSPGEDELYKEYKKSYESVKEPMDRAVNLYEKGLVSGSIDTAAIIKIIMEEIQVKGNLVRDSGNKLMEFHEKIADQKAESSAEIAKLSSITIFATIAICVVLGAFFAIIFSNGLVAVLTKISNSLNEAGLHVSAGSNQIASTAQELSQSNTEQSASLEETAASIEEMSSMIQKSTENAKKTFEFATSSKDSAVNGKQVVTEMIGSIEEINQSNQDIMEAINESNKRMEEIVGVIGEIGNKTKVINDIVFQTKLLSFNASVEAARAGEMGKGFAVVAEEVGNLAAMSGNAAKEISEMLSSSMTKVEEIVHVTKTKVERLVDEGKRKVDNGTIVAKRCGDVLDTIVTDVDDVTKLASEISSASDEQSKGIQEISKATAMLGAVTQQNSLASEESAKASEDLSRQAMELNNLVKELVLTVHGGSGEVKEDRKPAKTASSNVVKLKKEVKIAKTEIKKMAKQKTEPVSSKAYMPSADDDRFMDA